MTCCKKCGNEKIIKNGRVRGKQRYKCQACGYNFVEGDARKGGQDLAVKRALAVILYSLSKASFRFLGKLFNVSPTTAYNWIRKEADALPEPEVPGDIKEIEFDEMWHFTGSKKTKDGSSRRWTVCTGEPLPGLSVVVMLKPSRGSTKKSNT